MKFIYFGNGDYITEKFDNTDNFVKLIEELNENLIGLTEFDFVIYGGNTNSNKTDGNTNSNKTDVKSDVDVFTKKIRTFNKDLNKMIMFGSWDLFGSNGGETNLLKLLPFYSSNPDFEIFSNVSWKLIPETSTVLIMFDSNIFEYPNPKEILVSDTPFKYIHLDFMEVNLDGKKTIQDLIDYQFGEIYNIINKEKNQIKNIIFISQTPLVYQAEQAVQAEQAEQTVQAEQVVQAERAEKSCQLVVSNKHFINWLCENSLELNFFNLYYLSGGIDGFCSSEINLSKQIGLETINLVSISQYIVGTGGKNLLEKSMLDQPKSIGTENIAIEINSKFTGEPYKINLNFMSNDRKNFLGYLICEIKQNNFIDFVYFNCIDVNDTKQIEELKQNKKFIETIRIADLSDKKKIEVDTDKDITTNKQIQLNNKQTKKLDKFNETNQINSKKSSEKKQGIILNQNILSNIEISGSESDESGLNSDQESDQESDPEDPYRQKYIKYKNKLGRLRNNKLSKKN